MGISSYNLSTNYVICTSSTRPTGASLYDGLLIYETDTDFVYRYDGSAWKGTTVGKVPWCHVYRNAALNHATSNTSITVDFDTEVSDAYNIYASGLFTIPTGWNGAWILSSGLNFAVNATGRRAVQYTVNAGTAYNVAYAPSASGTVAVNTDGTIVVPDLVGGDVIRVQGFQDSGGSLAYGVGSAPFVYTRLVFMAGT